MKKMVAKKATKKYNNGGELTMKDKTNTVVRDKDNSDVLIRDKNKSDNSSKSYNSEVTKSKDNSRMKSTVDNSVANIDKGKVKYKIATGATVNFTAKSGRIIKKAQTGTVQSANQQTQSNVNKIAMKNAGDSLQKSAAGNAKNGKSMKKCKYGCK